MNKSVLEIITHAGNSKSSSMEAIAFARQGNIELANLKNKEAQEELTKAQKKQTILLDKTRSIHDINPDLLTMHAQDHLFEANVRLDLSNEIIELYQQINEIREYLGLPNVNKHKNIKILLVCGQGMSTSLLVQNMYYYAEEGDYIESTSFEELVGVISEYDVILISPQIRYRIPVIERMISTKTQKIGLIDMKAYGKLDGQTIYNQAKELFSKI